MQEIIDYSALMKNKSFLLFFIMNHFPEGMNSEEDSLSEIFGEKYSEEIDWQYIDDLTGYYDGVIEECDGYIDNPKSVKISLSEGGDLFIEFHPGDTIFYINDENIGCTGPHYMIRSIPLVRFVKLTEELSNVEKLFLLPMVKISLQEKNTLLDIVNSVFRDIDLAVDMADVSECIIDNCLEK